MNDGDGLRRSTPARPATLHSIGSLDMIIARRGGLGQSHTERREVLGIGAALFAWIMSWRASAEAMPIGGAPGFRWAAYYGQTAEERDFELFNMVVLDSAFLGSITAMSKTGSRVCGYVSVGEIRSTDRFFAYLPATALLSENADWPGTFRVDVRNPAWKALLLRRIIPDIVERGFTGLLLDTLDTPPYLEQTEPERFRGMAQAAIDIVLAIRQAFPQLWLGVNRGYAILLAVARHVDFVVAESLLTRPDRNTDIGYRWNDEQQVGWQLRFLTALRQDRPSIPVLSLDYWDPADMTTIQDIYRRERLLGNYPYVGTPLLDRIVPEPGAR